uniref:RNase H type-1 domain-containing protein n=1 Tax=Fagus sylvatica TaxID=28930 RepID=A0A2N9HLQ0_FAGSY
MPMTELYPILIEKSLISPIVPKPYNGPQRRDFNPNSACDFHFGEVGHTVENCGQLRHRVQDLIDHGVLKFEGLPNITTNPLPKHPEGGVNMVEVEEGNEESIAWRRLFYTLEKQEDTSPLGREEIPSSKGSRQPDDPSEFDWYAEINLDDIVEDEMDLDNLQDEEADWGYFMEDDTDEWRDDGDPEVHLQKYGEKMALHLENELLMISVFPESLSKQTAAWFYQLRNLTGWDDLVRVFLERYRFNPHSILEYLGLKKDEEPYIIPDPGVGEVIVEIKEEPSVLSLPALTEEEEEEHPHHCRRGGFHHHTTDPPLPTGRRSQDVDLRTIATACSVSRSSEYERITRKTSNDPHVSEIDNKTDCSLDNIDNSDEEIELPSDILEALERQDEGSKPNIEELEIVNLANEGEEPREVKIGTRCAAEQKEALIALLREFHEIFAWSYQDMPGLDTDIVVHKIPAKARMQARQTSTATDEARSHFEDQGRGGKAIEGRFPKHSNLFGLGSQYSPGAEEGRKTTNVVFSFMDGFSGYNQIKMAEEDKSKTAFVTHWGTFVYDVMPFVSYRTRSSHRPAQIVPTTEEVSAPIEPEQVCAFGVTSGKLLGFIVSGRGIEIDDPAKLTATCEPLFKLLRKDVKIKWTEDCQKAFDKIKEYLLNPPILVPPTPGRPLILYLTVQEASMGCMLGQQDETGKKEQAIYYLSKKFTEPETRYLLVEKTCCALAWASKKLRQYMLYYTTWLVSRMDPIKYIFEKPALTGKIARWQITRPEQLELMDSEFPDEDVMTVEEDNQGRWKLYFDGAANAVGSGIGAVLVSPKGQQTPIAVKLGFDCTNNMTEYEACIVGLQAALEFGAYELEVFGDSLLIVSQTNGEWQARDPKLIPYQRYISRLVPKFKYVTFTYTPRAHNHFADALATLASLIKLAEGDDVRPLRIETRDIPAYCVCIEECMNVEAEIDDKPWYYDIKRFIQDREYPSRATENEKKYIRRMAFQFFLERRDSEMHAGLMGAHANGPFLARKIMRAGYYWLTMERDCIRHVQTCHKCQMYQNSKNAPLPSIFTLWPRRGPFSAWGKWINAHHRQCFQPKQPHDGSAMPAVQDPAPQLCSIYRPKMNGAVEAANKNVKKILILSKMTETYKDWHEHLPYALCAYRTSVRTSVGATPLLSGLWDGSSTTSRSGDPFFENPVTNSARRSRMGPSPIHEGKFAPSYEGPYVVKKAFSGGAIILADMDGEEFRSPINSDSVIKKAREATKIRKDVALGWEITTGMVKTSEKRRHRQKVTWKAGLGAVKRFSTKERPMLSFEQYGSFDIKRMFGDQEVEHKCILPNTQVSK